MTHAEIQTGNQNGVALIPRDPEAPVVPRFDNDGDDLSTGPMPSIQIPEYAYQFVGEYKSPIGPKDATDHLRNPIETAMLDIARQAIFAPALLAKLYPELSAQTRAAYRTGGIKPRREEAGFTPNEMADRYLLSGIGERMVAIAGGTDTSLFVEQLRTIQLQSSALKQGAIEAEGLRSKLREHVVHSAQTRAFVAQKLSPEDLVIYDELLKADAIVVPEPEGKKSENSSGMQRFAEILEHAGLSRGWLERLHLLKVSTKQPPQSAEVEVVSSEQKAA